MGEVGEVADPWREEGEGEGGVEWMRGGVESGRWGGEGEGVCEGTLAEGEMREGAGERVEVEGAGRVEVLGDMLVVEAEAFRGAGL